MRRPRPTKSNANTPNSCSKPPNTTKRCGNSLTPTGNVLTFRLPITDTELNHLTVVVPAVNATLTDKLQWLAVHDPHTLRSLESLAERVLNTHRRAVIKHPATLALCLAMMI